MSRHIKELEDWIDVPLIDRDATSRRLAFTSQGKALGEAAVKGLAALQDTVCAKRADLTP